MVAREFAVAALAGAAVCCTNSASAQGIFGERLSSVGPYPRWTDVARTTMARGMLIASAAEVARRLRAEGLAISRQTRHRWLQALPLPD
ncbi:MAG: hypothetical protein K6U14_03745 [Firmicutes bacterium]|nr:hypothetical protein [Alicyclobacillaceae bacterium]MCL6496734.1 hypothetical protein [Bacillota bacterium]